MQFLSLQPAASAHVKKLAAGWEEAKYVCKVMCYFRASPAGGWVSRWPSRKSAALGDASPGHGLDAEPKVEERKSVQQVPGGPTEAKRQAQKAAEAHCSQPCPPRWPFSLAQWVQGGFLLPTVGFSFQFQPVGLTPLCTLQLPAKVRPVLGQRAGVAGG